MALARGRRALPRRLRPEAAGRPRLLRADRRRRGRLAPGGPLGSAALHPRDPRPAARASGQRVARCGWARRRRCSAPSRRRRREPSATPPTSSSSRCSPSSPASSRRGKARSRGARATPSAPVRRRARPSPSSRWSRRSRRSPSRCCCSGGGAPRRSGSASRRPSPPAARRSGCRSSATSPPTAPSTISTTRRSASTSPTRRASPSPSTRRCSARSCPGLSAPSGRCSPRRPSASRCARVPGGAGPEEPPLRADRLWLLGWLGSGLLAVAAGGYFRGHYFQLAVPPLALVAALGLDDAVAALGVAARFRAAGLAAAAAAAVLAGVLATPWYFLPGDPAAKSRRLYGANPFAESAALGAFLAERSEPGDTVFVYGSEPQILVHARRRSASRYVLAYHYLFGPRRRCARGRRRCSASCARRRRASSSGRVPAHLAPRGAGLAGGSAPRPRRGAPRRLPADRRGGAGRGATGRSRSAPTRDAPGVGRRRALRAPGARGPDRRLGAQRRRDRQDAAVSDSGPGSRPAPEGRGPPASRPPRRALAAVRLRARGARLRRALVLAPEGVLPIDGDSFYHFRRIAFTVRNFPAFLSFDPYVNFPRGGEPIWSPSFDFALAALVRAVLGDGDAGRDGALPLLRARRARRPPRRAAVPARPALPLGAGGLRRGAPALCVLPAHFVYSQVGFVDHHVAVSLAGTLLLFAAMGFAVRPGRAQAAWLGLALAAALAVWPGSLIHVGVAQAALLGFALSRTRARRGARRRAPAWPPPTRSRPRLLLPLCLGRTWVRWGAVSPLVLSNFQPLWLGAGALCFALLGEAWQRLGFPRTLLRPRRGARPPSAPRVLALAPRRAPRARPRGSRRRLGVARAGRGVPGDGERVPAAALRSRAASTRGSASSSSPAASCSRPSPPSPCSASPPGAGARSSACWPSGARPSSPSPSRRCASASIARPPSRCCSGRRRRRGPRRRSRRAGAAPLAAAAAALGIVLCLPVLGWYRLASRPPAAAGCARWSSRVATGALAPRPLAADLGLAGPGAAARVRRARTLGLGPHAALRRAASDGAGQLRRRRRRGGLRRRRGVLPGGERVRRPRDPRAAAGALRAWSDRPARATARAIRPRASSRGSAARTAGPRRARPARRASRPPRSLDTDSCTSRSRSAGRARRPT